MKQVNGTSTAKIITWSALAAMLPLIGAVAVIANQRGRDTERVTACEKRITALEEAMETLHRVELIVERIAMQVGVDTNLGG